MRKSDRVMRMLLEQGRHQCGGIETDSHGWLNAA
jgi:hypothetical protein